MISSYNTSLKLKMMPAINRRVERTHYVGPRSIEKRKHIGSENRKRAGIEKKLRGIGRGRMETDIIGVNICKGIHSFRRRERRLCTPVQDMREAAAAVMMDLEEILAVAAMARSVVSDATGSRSRVVAGWNILRGCWLTSMIGADRDASYSSRFLQQRVIVIIRFRTGGFKVVQNRVCGRGGMHVMTT